MIRALSVTVLATTWRSTVSLRSMGWPCGSRPTARACNPGRALRAVALAFGECFLLGRAGERYTF